LCADQCGEYEAVVYAMTDLFDCTGMDGVVLVDASNALLPLTAGLHF